MFSSSKMPSPDATYATHNAPLCQPNGLHASSHFRPWIGDIGYVKANVFVRVFNILLPASDTRQPSELPALFNPMSSRSKDGLNTVQNSCTGTCCSSSEDGRPRRSSVTFQSPPQPNITRLFRRDTHGSQHPTWHHYIMENVNRWRDHFEKLGLNCRLEDMILVTGFDLTTSPEPSFHIPRENSEETLVGLELTGDKHDCRLSQTERVFIRGFRFKLNEKVVRTPPSPRPTLKERRFSSARKLVFQKDSFTVPKQSLAVLMLDDILQRSHCTMAIVHDNDFSSFINSHHRHCQQNDERGLRAFMKDYLRSPQIKAPMHIASKQAGHNAGFIQLRTASGRQGK